MGRQKTLLTPEAKRLARIENGKRFNAKIKANGFARNLNVNHRVADRKIIRAFVKALNEMTEEQKRLLVGNY